MAAKFNSGRGGAVCDWCGAMLVDGERVAKPHRAIVEPGGVLHYCDHSCMQEHVDNDAGMHRRRSIKVAQEAARLALIARLHLKPELAELAAGSLVSREVK